MQHHPLNQERAKAGKAVANVVLLRGCGSRYMSLLFHKHLFIIVQKVPSDVHV